MDTSDNVFDDLSDETRSAIQELGWATPMPVQQKVIPLMHKNRDLIVQAQTGSGKTGAFGIPLVEAVELDRATTQALVMVPTRELASQVADEVAQLGSARGVRCLAVYGGVGYGPQLEALEKGAHIVIGTPGRILDHLGNGRMILDDVRNLILDEADEMLSLGFWPDIREIHGYLPKQRCSHLFSATIPEKVRSLSRYFLNDPEFVSLSEDQLAPQQIEHFFYLITAQEKESTLARILEYENPESAIIFCNTKADVRFLTGYLSKRGFDADQISGDLAQAARQAALDKIKAGSLRFLVATDVAARGIDISDLSHVISYATPESPEVYVHRTGRTGRAGKAGVAISLVSGLDIGNFRHLQHVNKIEIKERALPTEKAILDRVSERIRGKIEHEMRHVPDSELKLQVDRLVPVVEALVASSEGRRDLAAICAAYLREDQPAKTVTQPPEASDPEAARGDGPANRSSRDRPGRRRRPSGRRRS
jgi:ATP-dependent RNA helicase DeaD